MLCEVVCSPATATSELRKLQNRGGRRALMCSTVYDMRSMGEGETTAKGSCRHMRLKAHPLRNDKVSKLIIPVGDLPSKGIVDDQAHTSEEQH